MAFSATPLHNGPYEHAGKEQMLRIGDLDAKRKGPCRRIHRNLPELQAAFDWIFGVPSSRRNLHFPSVLAVQGKLSVFQVAFQSQQVGGGLCHVNVNGVQLLDCCKEKGLVSRNKGAVRYTRSADAPGNRRGNTGIAQIYACRFYGRLPVFNLSLGRPTAAWASS